MDQCVLQKKGDGLFSRRPEPDEPDELYEPTNLTNRLR
jgi:hypothetical protein